MNRSVGRLGRVEQGDRNTEAEGNAHISNAAAFASLYERHLPGIYSYLLVRTGHADDAADLAQQVFLQALAALPRYKDRGVPLSVWLFRIAHNLMADFHRRRCPTVAWEALPDSVHPASHDDVEATAIAREQIEVLRAVLARIEPEKRDLLALRFAAGLTVREIASVLGRRDAAVRSELRRLLRVLHREFSYD